MIKSFKGITYQPKKKSIIDEIKGITFGKNPKLMEAYVSRSKNHQGDTFEEYASYLKKVMDIK